MWAHSCSGSPLGSSENLKRDSPCPNDSSVASGSGRGAACAQRQCCGTKKNCNSWWRRCDCAECQLQFAAHEAARMLWREFWRATCVRKTRLGGDKFSSVSRLRRCPLSQRLAADDNSTPASVHCDPCRSLGSSASISMVSLMITPAGKAPITLMNLVAAHGHSWKDCAHADTRSSFSRRATNLMCGRGFGRTASRR